MRISKLSVILIALLLPLSVAAQKNKKVVKKPAVVAQPEPVEDPRITEMRELTQQVIFIDSVVVDKEDLLSAIMFAPESGTLTTTASFLDQENRPDCYAFVNEMVNKCYFADIDDKGHKQLFTTDKLGGEWSAPMTLNGIDKAFAEANYPFMMTDGITFYFAAKGNESIGGYDIFVTRFDSEEGKFLKPENIGMPFNSEANDYMYAIDELTNIGYFATDRRQPEGKVCVYVFIPPTTRKTYGTEHYSDSQLRSFAAISSIAKTWGDGKARKQALSRMKSGRVQVANNKQPQMDFVINDRISYTSENQFRSPESRTLYGKLTEAKKQKAEIQASLDKARNYYNKAYPEDKQTLRTEILDAEKQVERLTLDIKTLEKRIRNIENKLIIL